MQWKLLPRGAAPRAQGDDGGGKTMYCELCEEVKNVDDFSAKARRPPDAAPLPPPPCRRARAAEPVPPRRAARSRPAPPRCPLAPRGEAARPAPRRAISPSPPFPHARAQMQRGEYGVRGVCACLMHAQGDQRDWVGRLQRSWLQLPSTRWF